MPKYILENGLIDRFPYEHLKGGVEVGKNFTLSRGAILDHPDPDGLEFDVARYIAMQEKEVILEAMKKVDNGQTVALTRTTKSVENFEDNGTDFRTVVRVQPIEKARVYMYMRPEDKIPDDVFKCPSCQGYTYNDRYGNCSACGGVRDEDSFRKRL